METTRGTNGFLNDSQSKLWITQRSDPHQSIFPQESALFKQKTQAESSDPIGDVLDMIKAREDAVGYSSDEDESEEEEEWDD